MLFFSSKLSEQSYELVLQMKSTWGKFIQKKEEEDMKSS